MNECPRSNVEGHHHCFTYKQKLQNKVKKEQTVTPKEPEVVIPVLPSPQGVGVKSIFNPVLKLKDSGSHKKKKRTDHTFVPKVTNPKGEFREGSSEADDFERQPVNKKDPKERRGRKHKGNDILLTDDEEFERPPKKEKDRIRTYTKKQREHSFDEGYKKRLKEENDALVAGKSLSSAYVNMAATPTRPRARAKTKKMIEAEDDQALRKQRSMEKKLNEEQDDDLALELVSIQDQISYHIDTIQAEIKACDLALNHMPNQEQLRNPLEFTYISKHGNMKRNSRLYGDDESSEISDFSDSAISSWTDSLVESFDESEFEAGAL